MRSGGGLLAGGVIVPAGNRTGGGRRIRDFYRLFCRSVDGEFLTFEFSDSADLVHVRKRRIPNIITQVLHLNLNLTFKRSGYNNFFVCHAGLHSSRAVSRVICRG